VSWGQGAPTPPAVSPAGAPVGGGYIPRIRISRVQRKLFEEQRLSREAAEAIIEVARRQALRLESDEQKRFEELERELELRSVEWEARYLDLLNEQREAFIVDEIGTLLRRKIDEEEEMLLILIASSL
jgi:hypothetical protein